MKKNLLIFLLGLLVGTGGYWTFRDGPLATKIRESKLVQKVSDAFDERSTARLKEEMEKNGKITASPPADANLVSVDDRKLNDLVEAMLGADPTISQAGIKVEVKSGEVSLSGTAVSWEQIAHAIKLSLDCPGTRRVISTIAVKAK